MKKVAFGFLASFLVAGAGAQAQETVTFGAGAKGQASTNAGASGDANVKPPTSAGSSVSATRDDKDWVLRDRQMNEGTTLTGGVGLVHTQHAQGGAPGQFRVAFTTEFFSAGFLCTNDFPCRDPRVPATTTPPQLLRTDTTDHIGGHLTLSMQLVKWLEAYLATSAYANSNPANRPVLLQVLGDSVLGAKAHGSLGRIFHVGGGFELWLVNGTGAVGLDGGGTGAKFRLLATADLRGAQKPVPLRFSLNTTYVVDNTAQVIADTEKSRGTAITRVERFGLGINRVDHFDIAFGAEAFAAQEKVRPFIEYAMAVPINRQDYHCKPNNLSGDHCLLSDPVVPSSLTIGGRFFPWKRGFNLLAALDIGITGTQTFIEEVTPTPPWMLYLGAGWAFDTVDRPPVVKETVVDKGGSHGRKVRGFVHEEGKNDGIANAVIQWDNHPELTSLVTGSDGRFTTHELEEGPYVFGVRAEGYKPGQCVVTVIKPDTKPAPPPAAPPSPTPADNAGGDIQIDCLLAALPRVGSVAGHVKDGDSQAPIANAQVKIVDAAKRELSATSDANGAFHFDLVSPGDAQATADAEGYLATTEKFEIKGQKDNPVEVTLKKRPKQSNVTVGKGEIIIKQQIQFAVDSATILPESNGLLSEIADAMVKNPRIRKVEVQGHTDNTGTPEHNKKLSEDRASAVVAWLGSHGVAADRLEARGYGQTKPIVPNVTGANRAKNRRVQFIITEQDAANPAKPGAKSKLGGGSKNPF